PVGKRMGGGGSSSALDTEIIGFVKDSKYNQVKGQMSAQFFQPYRQDDRADSLTFYVQTSQVDAVMASIRPMVENIDATLPVESLKTLDDQARESYFEDRLMGTMAGSFAVLATILAAIGLYG